MSENPSPEYSSPFPGHGSTQWAYRTKKSLKWFVTVFVTHSLQLFTYSCLQQHTFLKITYKRCWGYIRAAEFLPEVAVSNEIKIQAKECGSDNGDQIE
jgi:hypothetical protein